MNKQKKLQHWANSMVSKSCKPASCTAVSFIGCCDLWTPLTPSAAAVPQASSPSPPPPSPPCPWLSISQRWRRTTSWSCVSLLQPEPPLQRTAAPGSGSPGTGRHIRGRAFWCRAQPRSGRWWGRRERWVPQMRWCGHNLGPGGGGCCHPSDRQTAPHRGWKMLWWGRLAVQHGAAGRREERLWRTKAAVCSGCSSIWNSSWTRWRSFSCFSPTAALDYFLSTAAGTETPEDDMRENRQPEERGDVHSSP